MPRPPSRNSRKSGAAYVLNARSLAQQCLEQVLLKNEDVQAALDALLRRHEPDPRDAGLATELVYGYLRLRTRCDFLVNRFLRKPGGTPPALRLLLGQCAYSLVTLERVPAYATVDWGVRAARKRFGQQLGRLANAVLRRVAETASSGQAGEPDFYRLEDDTEISFLSRYYSCPEWIVRLWSRHHDQETVLHWLRAQAGPPPVGLRLNRRRQGYEELCKRLRNLPGCIMAGPPGFALQAGAGLPELSELEREGALSRQSLASLQTLQQLGAFDDVEGGLCWPVPVWDACCGHGGKSCALLEAGGGELWCSDRSLHRLKGLRRELRRLELLRPPVFLADASSPPLFRKVPRTILVDAPCSGLGVLSRRPDAKWRRVSEDVQRLAALQRRILDAAAGLLPSGGRLAYVTCTLTPEENAWQLEHLRREYPFLQLLAQWQTPADSPLQEFFFGVLLQR